MRFIDALNDRLWPKPAVRLVVYSMAGNDPKQPVGLAARLGQDLLLSTRRLPTKSQLLRSALARIRSWALGTTDHSAMTPRSIGRRNC